jgi:hypothetical protein
MSEWKPIETAPRDGKSILVAWDERIAIVAWQFQPNADWTESYSYWALDSADVDIDINVPTHWMPLPELPK